MKQQCVTLRNSDFCLIDRGYLGRDAYCAVRSLELKGEVSDCEWAISGKFPKQNTVLIYLTDF
jgi:hypothetical protein